MNVPNSEVTLKFGTMSFAESRAFLSGRLKAGIRFQLTFLPMISYSILLDHRFKNPHPIALRDCSSFVFDISLRIDIGSKDG